MTIPPVTGFGCDRVGPGGGPAGAASAAFSFLVQTSGLDVHVPPAKSPPVVPVATPSGPILPLSRGMMVLPLACFQIRNTLLPLMLPAIVPSDVPMTGNEVACAGPLGFLPGLLNPMLRPSGSGGTKFPETLTVV